MTNTITCPNCNHQFEPGEIIRDEVKKELRTKMDEWQKKKQTEYDQLLIDERKKAQAEIETALRKSISNDFENKLKLLEQNNSDNEEKLKAARQKELEFLQKEQQLKNKEAELELSVQKRLQEERGKLSEELRKLEEQKNAAKDSEYQLRIKEMEKQSEDQKKLIEEMRRKSEQGSMQLQGESQELLLEEILRDHFPFDVIEEVGKGIKGADCIQLVRNHSGKECGKIIYESKRTKNWDNNWVEKLKADMRNSNADVAILVTQAFPKDMNKFGEKDGVWICSYSEIGSVAAVLRNAIIKVADAKKSEENKGEKMQLVYNYLTGNEFRQQVEAIVEGFLAMKQSIARERIQMEKMWKEREKQLDKVLISTSGMYGSVKGIAGSSVHDIPLLEGTGEEEGDLAH
ncbi:MAG: DUF2130 domain-containing protein [Chitinophagaceae bacterium]